MSILVGTASWAAKSLVDCGTFYPPEVRTAEGRLRYYATQFALVEVDSSYYALPSAANARTWVARTPHTFVFNLKAFRLFTGHASTWAVIPPDLRAALSAVPSLARRATLFWNDLPGEVQGELWTRFRDGAEPLRAAGRLGAVHFQFAPWVRNDPAGRRHVEECVHRMQGWPVSVEFRERRWLDDAHVRGTLAFERELGVAHTVVDCPHGFANTVPAVWETTTASLAVVRLHGRNTATWQSAAGTSGQRFDYDYPEAELAQLVPRVNALSAQASAVHVVFNNNHDSQAQRNARTFAKLLLENRPKTALYSWACSPIAQSVERRTVNP